MTLNEFADELSSDSAAPGGGSVAALAGTLGASLSSMVANLTFGKKKWLPLFEQMCQISQKSQLLKDELLQLIDADTDSFKGVLEAYKMPKNTDGQIIERNKAIDTAMKEATNIPFQTLKCCREIMDLALEAAKCGNPNSVSDAGVAAEMANAGVHGAALNVLINLKNIEDKKFCVNMKTNTEDLVQDADKLLMETRRTVSKIMNND